MRLAWLTDIHLDHLWPRREKKLSTEIPTEVTNFFKEIKKGKYDAILISGDIALAGHFGISNYFLDSEFCIKYLHELTGTPVYFVLGNHDYYFGSVATVRSKMRTLNKNPKTRWLTDGYVVEVTPDVAIMGHDGWYDLRNGYIASSIVMSEFEYVKEFEGYRLDFDIAKKQCQKLADEAARYFNIAIPIVFETYKTVIVLTHVPPFPEVCRYRGLDPSDTHLPFYSSQSIGNSLTSVAQQFKDNNIIVLSGHTHGAADKQILPNLRSLVGGARYGHPTIQKIISVTENRIEFDEYIKQ